MTTLRKTILIVGCLLPLVSCSTNKWTRVSKESFADSYSGSWDLIENKVNSLQASYDSTIEYLGDRASDIQSPSSLYVIQNRTLSAHADVDYVNCAVRAEISEKTTQENVETLELKTEETKRVIYLQYIDGVGIVFQKDSQEKKSYSVIYDESALLERSEAYGSFQNAVRMCLRKCEGPWNYFRTDFDIMLISKDRLAIAEYYLASEGSFLLEWKDEREEFLYEYDDFKLIRAHCLETAPIGGSILFKAELRQQGQFQAYDFPDLTEYTLEQ